MSAMLVEEEEVDVETHGVLSDFFVFRRGVITNGCVEENKIGPLDQYQQWVSEGKLRDDEYQRGMHLYLLLNIDGWMDGKFILSELWLTISARQ